MKQSISTYKLPLLALLAGIAGVGLRRWFASELEGGLLSPSALSPAVTGVVMVVFVALAGFFSHSLSKKEGFFEAFGSGINGILPAACGVALIVSCALSAPETRLESEVYNALPLVTQILGIIGGLGLAACGILQRRRVRPSFLMMLPVCLWMALRLINNYRHWSADPLLMNYCFGTLADMSAMLTLYYLAGYCFNRGKRRMTAFFCALSVTFCLITSVECVINGDYTQLLAYGALLVLCASSLIQLCRETGHVEE